MSNRNLSLFLLAAAALISVAHASTSGVQGLLPEGGMCSIGPATETKSGSDCGVAATAEPESMKGWELFTWKEKGTWRYALLSGRNSKASVTEIRAVCVESCQSLLSRLETLTSGAEIFWNTRGVQGLRTEFPPARERHEIQVLCRRKGVRLHLR